VSKEIEEACELYLECLETVLDKFGTVTGFGLTRQDNLTQDSMIAITNQVFVQARYAKWGRK
jgi:hypothetical protein